MQLKQLKLSGFKSFVDPTVVPFSSQLVAVVGPNGCGKSNIIDAVRWVMGEGSAKTLRGESMADVIFNGSTERKPIGQASVELVFDNSLGRLSGQFSSYQEISIKRLVTRDGDSSYFLNGSRCRRRDITDLFLGTGAGTRGYSIIGQNTISQLVEAKPEDLRAYLEEAAGVSKYKERRRETLQHIQHTRENLARVQDISTEIETQLSRLERQAKAAEQYKLLKDEERQCKANLLSLKWQALTREQEQKRIELKQLLLTHEEYQAHIAKAVNTLSVLDSQVFDTQNKFQTLQAQYYQVGNEVARLEEVQQQQKREKQQLEADRVQMMADIHSADTQLEQDTASYQSCQDEWTLLSQRTEELKATFASLSEVLQEKQAQAIAWNHKKQDIQSLLNQYQRDVQVETLNQQHLESRVQEALSRLEKIQMERSQYEVVGADDGLEVLREQQAIANDDYVHAMAHQQSLVEQGLIISAQVREIEQQLRAGQDETQSLRVEHASSQASLLAALRDIPQVVSENETECKRLVELIQIEEQWRSACEWVLGESLHAVAMTSLDSLMPSLSSLVGQTMVWVTPTKKTDVDSAFPRLLDKIEGFKPAWLYPLENVLTASTIEEALSWLPMLEIDQSIMTADGIWLGHGWLRTADFKKVDETSLVLRQKALVDLREALTIAEQNISELQQKREAIYDLRAENEQKLHLAQVSTADCQKILQDINAQFHQKQHAMEQAIQQTNRLQNEYDELLIHLESMAVERVRIDDSLSLATQQSQAYEQQLQTLLIEKTAWDDALNESQKQVEDARAALHETELQCNREQLKAQQFKETVLREGRRKEKLCERLAVLNQRLQHVDTPNETAKVELIQLIEKHQHLEQELNHVRQDLDVLQSQVRDENQTKLLAEQKDNGVQEQIVHCKLAEQSLMTRTAGLMESFRELEIDTSQCIVQDLSNMSVETQEEQLSRTSDKIKRLGAINLIAIDEYQAELARKKHLDEQSQDLNEALATLESAIAKMDEETRLRFEDTFIQVNTLFQTLFPRLFGGGNARLQLTCDNLLEAGVLVMAQPPGKRNSSIHLLSGGEKAMTAVALVFAIFQLNPSPFCMLDEVDAPLDDLNVGRFCDLVKEMSQSVQFLLITHNKVTMETAEHLIGVTMREPGVSRIVAVDVEMALI